jgi:hypothetical protein
MICHISYCNPIERATALRSIYIPPQYPQQASEWFGGVGTAADGPPPSPQVVVHGLTAHPGYDENGFGTSTLSFSTAARAAVLYECCSSENAVHNTIHIHYLVRQYQENNCT